jgi:hypothetical protein
MQPHVRRPVVILSIAAIARRFMVHLLLTILAEDTRIIHLRVKISTRARDVREGQEGAKGEEASAQAASRAG